MVIPVHLSNSGVAADPDKTQEIFDRGIICVRPLPDRVYSHTGSWANGVLQRAPEGRHITILPLTGELGSSDYYD